MNKIISIGKDGTFCFGDESSQFMLYYLTEILVDDLINQTCIFQISGSMWDHEFGSEYNNFPSNFRYLAANDTEFENYGASIYYSLTDSDSEGLTGRSVTDNFNTFSPDSMELVWESNITNFSDQYSITSSCAVNPILNFPENSNMMYFSSYLPRFEIRNRITGNIILSI
ncbi:MAG: hypothetical protein KAS49_01015 [Candidatus Cloacimonetes bacterium]|nr:hypothetical protein [Candidatus Cloacimonadota bacterium]